jgi:hypothetical protein
VGGCPPPNSLKFQKKVKTYPDFSGYETLKKKDSREFKIWRMRVQTNQKLDEFIFIEETKHENIRGDGDGRS